MGKNPTTRDVHHIRATYKPQVTCDGEDPETSPCGNPPYLFPWDTAQHVRAAARRHALEFPGHFVYVTISDVTQYVFTPRTDGEE